MHLGSEMGPNMGTTMNTDACTTIGQKLNSTSHTLFKCAFRSSKESRPKLLVRLAALPTPYRY
ncbi:hypothetical protein E2C01_007804 [Portunus trituberculatus]|uniref:Uncharacterized protein n=1 Tax=Portunus trituberculatus TaxID=210409 RepID=A0A5B7CZ49_PORTR|nr:hypothetical protein [Portunus trituberculatus]